MFARPEWFKGPTTGPIPTPRKIKGWAFYAICLAGILGPTILLVGRGQIFPEAAIWLGISLLAFFFEVRGVARDLRETEARKNLFFIDDSIQDEVETDQYKLKIQ